jgi:SET family sugar efflux transporter-like MFS transporter
MRIPILTTLRRIPGYAPFSLAALLLGAAGSFTGPFMPVFGREAVGMSPLALGVYLTLTALSSIVISTLLGRLSDRLHDRKPVVLTTLVAAILGYALLATTRQYGLVLLVGCALLGTAAGAFPQLFALARTHFASAGDAPAEQGVITLRSLISLAWMAGPAIAALILARGDFRSLFVVTAAAYALVALPVLLTRTRPPGDRPVVHAASFQEAAPTRPLWLVCLSFVLFGMANVMGFIALPIFVTENLHAGTGTVGFLVGLCALLEVPFILSFALFRRPWSNERLIALSFALFVLYFVLTALAPGVWLLALAQLVRAVVIAVTTTLGMEYFQELLPGRVGSALTLYNNTGSVGSILSGVVSGAFAQAFGYQAVFGLCGVLTGAAFVLLLVAMRAGGRHH